jgi:hypothetical protein
MKTRYLLIEEGEEIQQGDEFSVRGGWEEFTYSVGKTVEKKHGIVRRRLAIESITLAKELANEA